MYTHTRRRPPVLRLVAAMTGAVLLSLTGCTVAPVVHPTPTIEYPWGDETRPTLIITYEIDGKERTVTGDPDPLFCDGDFISVRGFGSEENATLGFSIDPDDPPSITASVIDDVVVRFTGRGGAVTETKETDGSTTYTTVDAPGIALIRDHPPAEGERINDLDMTGSEFTEEASASFLVTCPGDPGDPAG